MCHFALGNFEKAKEDFSICIKLEEKAAEPLERLKRATAKASSSTNSKIGRGIPAPPSSTSDTDTFQHGPQKRFVQIATTHALFNRALCLLHLHKSKQALRDFDRALHVDSGAFWNEGSRASFSQRVFVQCTNETHPLSTFNIYQIFCFVRR